MKRALAAQSTVEHLDSKERRLLKKLKKKQKEHQIDEGSYVERVNKRPALPHEDIFAIELDLSDLAVDNPGSVVADIKRRKEIELSRHLKLVEEQRERDTAARVEENRQKLRRVANVDKEAVPGLQNKRLK
ncbi:hypothetical protein HDV00_012781 [Rhizophlyctis rosea]|nr:hypothetical protein HDV00_012781 [Rhizophlyctis rosea]